MSFTPHETHPENGEPIELFEFRYGDANDAVYRYTSADRDHTFSGVVWKATPIKREAYKSSGKTEKTSLSIRVPVNTDLSELFTEYPPTQPVTITIRTGHLSDNENDFLVIWTGRVLSTAKEGNESVLTCDNTVLSLKRPGLRRNYQYGCPFVLYGSNCRANRGSASVIVAAISGSPKLVLPDGWWGTRNPADFNGGMLSWRTGNGVEYRTIRRVDDDGMIHFTGPIRGINPGTPVEVILGCNHQMDHCQNLHNNIQNYGGQPWIPTKNPTKYHPFW